jgi:glucose/mannose-6-phosphate isomerase
MSNAPARKSPLFDLAFALPEHLTRGARAASGLRGLPQRSDIDNILILGMGTGRSAGDAVQALGSPTIPVPILVESSYEIPACVGKRSLVFAISGSGNTDEVNHAAAASVARGARLVAISVGGWLIDFAEDCGAAIVRIPPDIQPARATFGVVVTSLLTALQDLGFLPDAGRWIDSASAQ